MLEGEPRLLQNKDVINGKQVQRNGRNKDTMVLDCYRYIRSEVPTPDGRTKTVYIQPFNTLCRKRVCSGPHWHRDTLELMTVRPPLVCRRADVGKKKSGLVKMPVKNSPARPKRRGRGPRGGSQRVDESESTRFELAPSIAQKVRATIMEDRAYLLRTRKTAFNRK